MKGAILAGFAALASRLGYMQIVKGDFYQARNRQHHQSWQVRETRCAD